MKTFFKWFFPLMVISAICIYYQYQEIVFYKPQSIHHWRQSDCASLTLTYAQEKNPWYEPQIHGLINDLGTSGNVAPSEVPLYYKIVSALYHVFGQTDFWLRCINTILFIGGIYSFCLTLIHASKSILWGSLSGSLLLTSPILAYYGNNFITNTPALGIALMGLSSWYCFIKTYKFAYYYLFIVLFLLAGSLKLPALFLFLAIIGSEGWALLLHRKRHISWKQLFTALIVVITPLLSWVWYARSYNTLHQTTYFSTTIFPIWMYSPLEVKEMMHTMWEHWGTHYFHNSLNLLFLISFLVALLPRTFSKTSLKPYFFFLALLAFAFFFLQFYTFVDHDYYTINLFIIPAVLILMLSETLANTQKNRALLALIPFGLLVFNAVHARENLNWRYSPAANQIKYDRPFLYDAHTESFLDSTGVLPTDTIIFLRDASHTPLYLLNRKGWTDHKMEFKNRKPLIFNQDSAQIAASIQHGAKYLLVAGKSDMENLRYIRPFAKKLLGVYKGLYVFSTVGADSISFFSQNIIHSKTLLKDGFNQYPYNGRKNVGALRVLPSNEFSETHLIDSLKTGDKLLVTIWRNSSGNGAIPVIQGNNHAVFEQQINVVNRQGQWNQLLQEHTITPEDSTNGLKVFIWNPKGDTAYFDDLEIKLVSAKP